MWLSARWSRRTMPPTVQHAQGRGGGGMLVGRGCSVEWRGHGRSGLLSCTLLAFLTYCIEPPMTRGEFTKHKQ